MGEISGALFKNITETQLIKSGVGKVYGAVVNSHTSGTLKLQDGVDDTAGVVASSTLTTSGIPYAAFATNTLTANANFLDKVKASSVLTSSGAMVPAAHGTNVLTSDATNVADAEVVVIGAITYRFKDTMAQAYDVKIGADAATSLANLKKAINGTGTAGVEYFTGTVAHTLVCANELAATTLQIWSRTIGTANNTLATTETSGHLSWADTTLGGGTGASNPGVAATAATITINGRAYTFVVELSETSGATAVVDQILYGGTEAAALDNMKLAINAGATAGTNYSTGTVVNADVEATTNTNTEQTILALVAGTVGNAITTTETLANTSWTSTVLTGGLEAETITIGAVVYRMKDTLAQAYDVKIGVDAATSLDNLKLAINATGTPGTHYYAGTVVHPYVIATTNTDTTQKVESRTYGTTNNTLATTETGSASISWADTTLGGGTGASDPGAATATATFTIDGISYYFTSSLSETTLGASAAVANEILWVTNDATALDNMKLAINGSGTEGTNYSTGTNAHPTVIATTNANTTQVIESRLPGSQWNAIATTEAMATTSWTGTTLSGGTDAARLMFNTITFAAGPSVWTFPEPVNFVNGLFATVGGTADLTLLFN